MEKNNEINPAIGGVKNKVIQTYAEDMAGVIENDREGLIKKIIHGEEQREKEKNNLSPESQKNKLFMVLGMCFVVLSIIILSYFLLNRTDNTVPVEKQYTPLIFNDKSSFLEIKDFNKEEIIQSVKNTVGNTEVKIGGVEGIYLTLNKNILGLREFISTIKGNFIAGDAVLVYDNFLMGVVNNQKPDLVSTDKSFFILIKMRSIPDIFQPMREWENKMFLDLAPFFDINISPENNMLSVKDFEDGTVENKNARILYDKDRNIIMMYIFADDNSIIITNSNKGAHEIMIRLASSTVGK
jgi:hypothetical protein